MHTPVLLLKSNHLGSFCRSTVVLRITAEGLLIKMMGSNERGDSGKACLRRYASQRRPFTQTRGTKLQGRKLKAAGVPHPRGSSPLEGFLGSPAPVASIFPGQGEKEVCTERKMQAWDALGAQAWVFSASLPSDRVARCRASRRVSACS